VKSWRDQNKFAGNLQPNQPDKRDVMLRLLNQLGDRTLLEEFIAEVVTRDYDGRENLALVAAASLLGAMATGKRLTELVRRKMPAQHGQCVDLLQSLTAAQAIKAQPEWLTAVREIAEAAVNQLDEVGKQPRQDEWMEYPMTGKIRHVNALLVANLLAVLGELDAAALRSAAAEKFAARPNVFDPVTILVPALSLVPAWDAAVVRLWEHSATFLLQRSGQPPTAPTDWRQEVQVACACADCQELQAFTCDPVKQTHRFRVKKERRQHLHQQIEALNLDMTHVTDRKGSPQTLVCTKDRRSYQRHCDQYQKDIAALGHLAERAKKSSAGNSVMLKQLAAARTLADKWSPPGTK
jgi:hypothetical protein